MAACMNKRELKQVAKRLGHAFARLELLEQALTHKSYANEAPPADGVLHNERLEFLGDAVLSLVVGEQLMVAHPEFHEGELSRMRAALVNGEELANCGRQLELGLALRLGRGEERSGGREKASILADAFEAVLAAAYLDGGLDAARRIVQASLGDRISGGLTDDPGLDPKSRLQEVLQAAGQAPPDYFLMEASGPDHDLRFQVEVRQEDRVIGRGRGRSKKAAEQAAARDALEGIKGAGESDRPSGQAP